MDLRVLILLLALLPLTDDGSKKGRKGNESYRNEQHSEAASLYREGIEEADPSKAGGILAGLWNNLGASLFRMSDFEQARSAFSNALALAGSSDEVSRFAYNAGNTTYMQTRNAPGAASPEVPSPGGAPQAGQGLQESLEFYKQALLADPENQDAKFNYEFVKRQLEEQQQQDQDPQNQDNQDPQSQDQQQNEEQQNQQPQQQEDPTKLSREEAERILQALQNEEEELLRQVLKPETRPRKVEKDW